MSKRRTTAATMEYRKLRSAFDTVIRIQDTEASRSTDRTAQQAVAELRAIVGRQYPPASLPGEPPARRTGEYQTSIRWRRMSGNTSGLYTTSEIGTFLEWGTRYMAPRPHWRPYASVLRRRLNAELKQALMRGRARATGG